MSLPVLPQLRKLSRPHMPGIVACAMISLAALPQGHADARPARSMLACASREAFDRSARDSGIERIRERFLKSTSSLAI